MEQIDFGTFEHLGWERVAQSYHAYFGKLTVQSSNAMLDALAVQRDTQFLDVASGPGYLAAAAASRGAKVVGVDFSATMVAQAKHLHPDLEFRVGDAENLPFPDACFDAAGIAFGMLHFPHPERALEHVFRVLKPGGRIAFSVWASPDRAVGFRMVLAAVAAHGTMDVPLPPGPPFFRFSDPDESARALLDAGFVEPQVQEIEQTLMLRAPETPFHMLMRGGVRMAAVLNAQTPDALAQIESAVARDTEPYRNDAGELCVPMPCIVASALKR
ncbi:methyltransferase domain-containing protein [Burkholderia sp. Bp8963]|nr:methyltransferase domain-containing protein [Burkholderia sp. Bp8963]